MFQRFARQHGFKLPSKFLSTLLYSRKDHHFSGQNEYILFESNRNSYKKQKFSLSNMFASYESTLKIPNIFLYFHYAFYFSNKKLIHSFNSLARVSRRVGNAHYTRHRPKPTPLPTSTFNKTPKQQIINPAHSNPKRFLSQFLHTESTIHHFAIYLEKHSYERTPQ